MRAHVREGERFWHLNTGRIYVVIGREPDGKLTIERPGDRPVRVTWPDYLLNPHELRAHGADDRARRARRGSHPMSRRCFFAGLPDAGPCDGRLVKAHLIPRQFLKRELNAGPKVINDPRTWVWCCGGPVGVGGHHGRFDARGCDPLRIPRHRLPPEFEAWCGEMALDWFLDREYGALDA